MWQAMHMTVCAMRNQTQTGHRAGPGEDQKRSHCPMRQPAEMKARAMRKQTHPGPRSWRLGSAAAAERGSRSAQQHGKCEIELTQSVERTMKNREHSRSTMRQTKATIAWRMRNQACPHQYLPIVMTRKKTVPLGLTRQPRPPLGADYSIVGRTMQNQ